MLSIFDLNSPLIKLLLLSLLKFISILMPDLISLKFILFTLSFNSTLNSLSKIFPLTVFLLFPKLLNFIFSNEANNWVLLLIFIFKSSKSNLFFWVKIFFIKNLKSKISTAILPLFKTILLNWKFLKL